MKQLPLYLMLISCGLLMGCSSGNVPDGPALDRVNRWYENPDYTWGTAKDLHEWINTPTPTIQAQNPENRWSSGLAASMTPFVVDWEHSTWDLTDDTVQTNTYAIVKNVYVSGNPILGEVNLATIRIPEGGIKDIELVLVRYALKGIAKTGGHVQLRFIFHEHTRPERLNNDGSLHETHPYIDDLMISWEAWRPTQEKWKFKPGLEKDKYHLTARMYSGEQRYLQDLLRGAVWECYPLDLSKVDIMGDAILASGLMLGDGLSRKLIWSMIEHGLIIEPSPEIEATWKKQDKIRARRKLAFEGIPDSPIKPMIEEIDPGYHAIQQSCINASLKQIDLALEYLHETKGIGSWPEIEVAPKKIPTWFDDVAEGNGWAEFYNAPYAFFWFLRHKEIMPYKAYTPLEDAGLLKTDHRNKPVFYRYGLDYSSPYGPLKDRIM